MRRALTSLGLGVALAALLAACTANVAPTRLQFSMAPTGTLGYEVDQNGNVTVETRFLRFRNTVGSPGLTLTGYTIEYFNQNGGPVPIGDNVSQGSLNVYVPPGIMCDEPDPVLGCTVTSEGRFFAPGPEVQTEQGYNLLPAGVAFAHIDAGFPVGWYGDITFTGFDGRGAVFESAPYRLAIAPPD